MRFAGAIIYLSEQPMSRYNQTGQAGAIEAALIEAASSLSSSLGESVPLDDYRASVLVFFEALESPLCEEALALFSA